MGRFSDLWASGKFAVKARAEQDERDQTEAAHIFQEMSPELGVPEGTKAIFDALKSRRGQETGRWLRELSGAEQPTANQIVESSTPAAASANAFDETVAWVDGIFKEFADLAFEFNKTAVGSDLLVSYDNPQLFEKKSDAVWYKPVTRTYQGRLTTRQWALIIRGMETDIGVLLLPASMLLAFSGGQITDSEYPPFMQVSRGQDGKWSIGGETVTMAAIPHLAKELLGDLIRVSSGVMNESELFSKSSDKPVFNGNLAVGYKGQPAPASAASQGVAQTAPQPNALDAGETDTQNLSIHDACDIVDEIVNFELKRLYEQAGKLQPGAPGAESVRKSISAVEKFRTKIVEAFEEYTHSTLPANPLQNAAPDKSDLLR